MGSPSAWPLSKSTIFCLLLAGALAAYGLVWSGFMARVPDSLSSARRFALSNLVQSSGDGSSLDLSQHDESLSGLLNPELGEGVVELSDPVYSSEVVGGSNPVSSSEGMGGDGHHVAEDSLLASSSKSHSSCRVDLNAAGKPGGKQVYVAMKNMQKVSKQIFHGPTMEKYGFVKEDAHANTANAKPVLIVFGMLGINEPDVVLSMAKYKEIHGNNTRFLLLKKSDVAVQLFAPGIFYHDDVVAIFSEYVLRNASLLTLSQEELGNLDRKYHIAVICSSPMFINSETCRSEHKKYSAGRSGIPRAREAHLTYERAAYDVATRRLRAVNWNFVQYYEMEPLANVLKVTPDTRLITRTRPLDVFCGIHLRNPDFTPLELHRLAVLTALSKYTGPKLVLGCSRYAESYKAHFKLGDPYLSTRCLNGKEYRHGMLSSKVVVCAWGFGERTGCDVSAMLLGAVVLKPYMDWVLAFPDVYQNGRYYIPFKPDASDLLDRVTQIRNGYGLYQPLRERAQAFCIQSVSRGIFVDRFWAEACDAYVNHRHVRPYSES